MDEYVALVAAFDDHTLSVVRMWSVWQPVFERSMRRGFTAIGSLERSRADWLLLGDPVEPCIAEHTTDTAPTWPAHPVLHRCRTAGRAIAKLRGK